MTWTRRLWMRLGVINALCSVVVGLVAFRADDTSVASLLRVASGFQFMHSMSTFACATFMNIGATQARNAPALFLTGSSLFSGALYGQAFGYWTAPDMVLGIGAALMAGGWGLLFMAAAGVDRDA